MAMKELARQREEIKVYLAGEMPERQVSHLERVGVDHVFGHRHETWDIHLDDGERWWVLTNPTNYYSQSDFKSRDVVLTFHLGLAMRVAARYQVPITERASTIFQSVWRRWEQAVEALVSAEQAEHFQTVGTHLRETLISLAHELQANEIVPTGTEPPKASDLVAWTDLFVRAMTPGKSNSRLRVYVSGLVQPTWDYQQHLLHNKNATRMDAEIGVAAVEHLIATVTALVIRAGGPPMRCPKCDAYGLVAGACNHCGWEDANYHAPTIRQPSEAEIAEALAQPCTPSSDISTLMTVDEALESSSGVKHQRT
jgi:hypothetical protein